MGLIQAHFALEIGLISHASCIIQDYRLTVFIVNDILPLNKNIKRQISNIKTICQMLNLTKNLNIIKDLRFKIWI